METRATCVIYSRLRKITQRLSFEDLTAIMFVRESELEYSDELDPERCSRQYQEAVLDAYKRQLDTFILGLPTETRKKSGNINTDVASSYILESNLQKLRAARVPGIENCFSNFKRQVTVHAERVQAEYTNKLNAIFGDREATTKRILANLQAQIDELEALKNKERAKFCRKYAYVETSVRQMEENIKLLEEYRVLFELGAVETTLLNQLSFPELIERVDQASYATKIIDHRALSGFIRNMINFSINYKYKGNQKLGTIIKGVNLFSLILFATVFGGLILGGLSAIYLINLCAAFLNVYKYRESLRFARYLSHNVDAVLKEVARSSKMTKTYRELSNKQYPIFDLMDADSLEELTAAEAQIIDGDLDELSRQNPAPSLAKIASYCNSDAIARRLQAAAEQIMVDAQQRLNVSITSMETDYKDIMTFINETLNNFKPLGTVFSEEKVLSTKIKLAQKAYKDGRPYGYAEIDFPFENVFFQYSTPAERDERLSLLKVFLSNVICNIKERCLRVDIYDSDYLGKDVAEFASRTVDAVVQLHYNKFEELRERLTQNASEMLFKIGTQTLNEYNAAAQKAKRTTMPYNLFVLMSTDVDITTKKEFLAFLDYSTARGFWVWVFAPKEIREEEKDKNRVFLEEKMPIIVNSNEGYIFRGEQRKFDLMGLSLIPGTIDLGMRTTQTLAYQLEHGKQDFIDYETAYRQVHLPDSKIWTYDTLRGIEFRFGYLDGDPTNPYSEMLGDDAVHALMVGQTGAGKSATINVLIASLLYMYSPEWLKLVMVDFKNVEFNMYTGDCLIPHASVIAGTKDGEYAVSIFEYLMEEMKARTRLFSKYKMQKLEDYNRAVLAGKLPGENILPRILVLIDEFQVMFTEVEPRIVDIIKGHITSLSKLARFCGCHLFFTSQSMKGTMSQDILEQFKMRACLACSKEVSNDVLGNDAASYFIGKGNIVTNSQIGGPPKHNHTYKIPYAPNSYIKEYLPRLIAKAAAEGKEHRQADFFDEEQTYELEVVADYYSKHPDLLADNSLFFLGESTVFTQSILPVNIRLLPNDGEHVLLSAYEREDACNLLCTFMENLRLKQDRILIVASIGDTDISTLVDMPSLVSKPFREMMSQYRAGDIVKGLLADLQRREDEPGDYPDIYYFIVGYDKVSGLGVAESYQLQDAVKSLLQRGASCGIHLIVYARECKPIRNIRAMFNYGITSVTTDINSDAILNKTIATKLAQNIAIMMYGVEYRKFKIYGARLDKSKLPPRTLEISKGEGK